MLSRVHTVLCILALPKLIFTEDPLFKYYDPTSDDFISKQDKDYWYHVGGKQLERILAIEKQKKIPVAKNVVVMIGDGMGLPTVTATRIYRGQREFGKSGEEHNLVYDMFPNVGLVKTYNVDMQVPDSAGTATALLTGVKVRFDVIGLDVRCRSDGEFDKDLYEKGKLESIMDWAQRANKSTGVITTTRISHATPAATYAHVNSRKWECDNQIPEKNRKQVKDISRQLFEDLPGKNFKVILGGGLQQLGYLAQNESDECIRTDGLNLTRTWIEAHPGPDSIFATKNEDLDKVSNNTEFLLGIFHADHVPYELIRDKGPKGTPSLSQMTRKGLQVLKKAPEGFVLMVEAGRIDLAHHWNYARLALEESAEFDRTVALVVNETGPDTLIIVTADHSHSMTMNGYGRRGNDILGYGILDRNKKKPALTVTYANGPGFSYHYTPDNLTVLGPWIDPAKDENRLRNTHYQHMATFEADDESHAGEDVGIYATGPGSHLVRGVMEQNYVAHLISYAACIGPRSALNPDCAEIGKTSGVPVTVSVNSICLLLIVLVQFVLYSF